MPQIDPTLVVTLLSALAAGALLFVSALPLIEARNRRRRRLSLALRGDGAGRPAVAAGAAASSRRKAIEKTLREIEERQAERTGAAVRPTLAKRLSEAGLTLTPLAYWAVSAALAAAVAGALVTWTPVAPPPAGALGLAVGLLVPHLYVSILRQRRLARFSAGFPDTIDIIVRGVRSGRPLADCFAIVAADSEEPLRSEFRQVVTDQSVGLPIQEAVDRLARRVSLPEVKFLSIVISIQNRAGGNLTEALGNLSNVLRARRQLQAKVKALSAEAKASAGIIGSLPVVMAGIVHFTSPDYLALLYQTDLGRIVILACVLWMALGIFVMRQMINFDM
jgi:tight adherence protein B